MFENIKADINRYKSQCVPRFYLFFEQGLWAIFVYRLGRVVREFKIPIFSTIVKLFAFLLFKIIEITTGISIPASANIGKGFYVGHFGSVIVHSDAIMGENCSIGPGVVIGTKGMGNKGVPHLGNNVYVGVGAKVLGGITIGDNVKIGANAVVLNDIPDNATVVGIPARIVENK